MEQNELNLKVTQASLNQTALDWARNISNIYKAIDKAVAEGSDILALEELTLTGYEVNDDFERTDNNRILEALKDIAAYAKAQNPNLIISVGHPWRLQMRDKVCETLTDNFEKVKHPLYDRTNLPFNVQTTISNGKILGMTAKTNLFNNERGYEKRYFNEWSIAAANQLGGKFGTLDIDIEGLDYKVPFGRPIIAFTDGNKTFFTTHAICEEKWVATKYDGHPYDDSRYEELNIIPNTLKYLGDKAGLVMLIPNASPPSEGKMQKHEHLDILASNYVDALIDTDGLGSSGSTFAQFGHRVVAKDGEIINKGRRMSFNRIDTDTTVVTIKNAKAETALKSHATAKREFTEQLKENNIIDLGWDNSQNPNLKYEEAIRNTAFWLFDYMRKAGLKGVAEALSGGADSAFNTTIVAVMVKMGIKELGAKKFCEELKIPYKETDKEILQDFLTGVYMGTRNSSKETRHAARFLMEGGFDPATGKTIEGIGGKFMERDVDGLMDFYSDLYKAPITPEDGVAYENIQARGRQVLINLIANKEGKLAIANPNLDEARNAYATFGGDLHSGMINLNGHLNKDFQLELMQYMYDHGVEGIMPPVKALGPVLKNKPSAELLPMNADGTLAQTDETALQRNFKQMDRISDHIITTFIDTKDGARRLNAGEVFEHCQKDPFFKQVDENQLYNMVRVSYYRWGVSQHKIHATPITPTWGRNVDHQTSKRTPNISGNSKDELAALGVNLMFKWAAEENLNWDNDLHKKLNKKAWQDEDFLKEFDGLIYNKTDDSIDYNLKKLYTNLKDKGWNNSFKTLSA